MQSSQVVPAVHSATNPLTGLSSAALRLYGALEVFRDASPSSQDWKWFHAPRLNQRLRQIGFSKSEIEKGFTELVGSSLLEVRSRRDIQWYQLR